MHSSTILTFFLLTISCIATEINGKSEAEIKTTFLTLTKPCSTTTSAATIVQNTHVAWPVFVEGTKEVIKHPATVYQATYTATPVVKGETSAAMPVGKKETIVPSVENEVAFTSSIHGTTTTTCATSSHTTTASVKKQNSDSPNSPPGNAESTSAAIYTPSVKQDTTKIPTSTPSKSVAHFTETKQSSAAGIYTLIPTPAAACTCPAPTATPESPIPRIPVKEEEMKAFDFLLSLLLSVPDNVLSTSDQAISTFYTNLSTCIDSKGAKLAQSFIEFGELFRDIDFSNPKEIIEDTKDTITSVIQDKLPEATKVLGSIIGEITAAPKKVVDTVGEIFSNLDIGKGISTVSKAKRQSNNPLDKLGEIVNDIDTLRGCLAAAIATNPIFEVAKCAASIAGVVGFPVARVLRIRGLVAGVGGKLKVLAELRRGGNNVRLVARGVLDVVEEVTGVAGVVRDCKFLVD